jgi:hypothetical protein
MARSQKQHLVIPAEIYDAMIAHCIKGSPVARFGILAGTESLVSAIYPLRNAAESSVRYESDPSHPLSSDRSFPDFSGGGVRPRRSPSATFTISHLGNPNRCATRPWTVLENEIIPTSEAEAGVLPADDYILITVLSYST